MPLRRPRPPNGLGIGPRGAVQEDNKRGVRLFLGMPLEDIAVHDPVRRWYSRVTGSAVHSRLPVHLGRACWESRAHAVRGRSRRVRVSGRHRRSTRDTCPFCVAERNSLTSSHGSNEEVAMSLVTTTQPIDGVGVIKLDDPPKNFGSYALLAELEQALSGAASGRCRAVILTSDVPGYFMAHAYLPDVLDAYERPQRARSRSPAVATCHPRARTWPDGLDRRQSPDRPGVAVPKSPGPAISGWRRWTVPMRRSRWRSA